MTEALAWYLGMAGTALSTASLLPQVWRSWRTRQARDISMGWLAAALAGTAVWTAYGILAGAPAVVWANVLTAVQFLAILGVKLSTERRPAA